MEEIARGGFEAPDGESMMAEPGTEEFNADVDNLVQAMTDRFGLHAGFYPEYTLNNWAIGMANGNEALVQAAVTKFKAQVSGRYH